MRFGTKSMGRKQNRICVTTQAKLVLLTLGYCDTCLNSPKNPRPGEGGNDGGQEKRRQGDTDKLAETGRGRAMEGERPVCVFYFQVINNQHTHFSL